MMLGIIALANRMHLRYVDPHDLERLILPSGEPVPPGYDQKTVIAQLAAASSTTSRPASTSSSR